MSNAHGVKNVLSFDIEDWFHILDLPENPMKDWSMHESRVEKNTLKILDIIKEKDARATFFVLGWIAERYPQLVKEIQRQGHEIGCHGHGHQLITDLSKENYRADLLKSSEILNHITGKNPVSYRGPGFSITTKNSWALEVIAECGFKYDSTIYPGRHGHGGILNFPSDPTKIIFNNTGRELFEFPITTDTILGKVMGFSGGGYLRLLPYHFIIKRKFKKCVNANRPVMVYLHPRDLDPETPKLKMPLYRRFKSYVNINSTEKKLERLLSEFKFTTLQSFMDNHQTENFQIIRM